MLRRWTLPWTDAKYHLSESLRSGEEGEPVVITRNGKPVAQLVPPSARTRVVRFGSIAGPHPPSARLRTMLSTSTTFFPVSFEGVLARHLIPVSAPKRLSGRAKRAIEQGPAFLGGGVLGSDGQVDESTLDVGDPRQWYGQRREALAMRPLLCRPEHVAEIFNLPAHHQDPFDRALIEQATVKDLALVTTDATIPCYASRNFRVVR